jgi:hypothetical protein
MSGRLQPQRYAARGHLVRGVKVAGPSFHEERRSHAGSACGRAWYDPLTIAQWQGCGRGLGRHDGAIWQGNLAQVPADLLGTRCDAGEVWRIGSDTVRVCFDVHSAPVAWVVSTGSRLLLRWSSCGREDGASGQRPREVAELPSCRVMRGKVPLWCRCGAISQTVPPSRWACPIGTRCNVTRGLKDTGGCGKAIARGLKTHVTQCEPRGRRSAQQLLSTAGCGVDE